MRSLVFLMLMSGPCIAGDAETISHAATACWSVPMEAEAEGLEAVFEVDVDANGRVLDITVKGSDGKPDAKPFIVSASRAIERCAPYKVTAAGTIEVKMSLSAASPIDPFKNGG